MRILFHAHEYRDRRTIQTHAEDAHTSTGPFIHVASENSVRRLLRYVGGFDESSKNRGPCAPAIISEWVDLIPGRKNLLRLRAPGTAISSRPATQPDTLIAMYRKVTVEAVCREEDCENVIQLLSEKFERLLDSPLVISLDIRDEPIAAAANVAKSPRVN